jgi:hypothetical protein
MDRKRAIHMAGIVPIAGQPLDFKMPWNDSLIPIAPDYLAAERAVYECAVAGCETIWVVCHVGTEPLLRKRLGDYIVDPVTSKNSLNPSLDIKNISIFYVPIHPKDKERRDCLSWSILYGADNAFRVSSFLSKWTMPTKYYCAFPYGITPEETIWKNRDIIGLNKKTIFSYDGKNIKDGLHISFTFDQEDYKKGRDIIKNREINTWNHMQRESAADYTLAEVFSALDTSDCHVVELPWYYEIDSWEKYCAYLASGKSSTLYKNKYSFIKEKRKNFPNYKDVLNDV